MQNSAPIPQRPYVHYSGVCKRGSERISFPSGHSQNAVSTFGALFLTTKKLWFKITLGVLAGIVLFSRMYLGVHTPWDVIAGASAALVILLLLEEVFKKDELFSKVMPYLVGALTLAAIGFFVYAMFFSPLPEQTHITYDAIYSAKKNAATLLGCAAGLCLVYPLDRFVIKFETKAHWYAQIIKLAVGLGVILGIKLGLGALLNPVLDVYARIITYFVMVAFAGAVWPLTFGWFSALEINALNRFGKWVASLFCRLFRIPEAESVAVIEEPVKVKDTTPTYFGENSMFKKKKKRR